MSIGFQKSLKSIKSIIRSYTGESAFQPCDLDLQGLITRLEQVSVPIIAQLHEVKSQQKLFFIIWLQT